MKRLGLSGSGRRCIFNYIVVYKDAMSGTALGAVKIREVWTGLLVIEVSM